MGRQPIQSYLYSGQNFTNGTTVTPTKSKAVPVTLLNTNSYNVWIRQSLLAADIVKEEHYLWDFHSTFCPVPTLEVQEEVLSFGVAETKSSSDTGTNQYNY